MNDPHSNAGEFNGFDQPGSAPPPYEDYRATSAAPAQRAKSSQPPATHKSKSVPTMTGGKWEGHSDSEEPVAADDEWGKW
jgi:hypothetical protein